VQQGQGPRPYDVATRRLIDLDPAAWLRWAGLTVDGPAMSARIEQAAPPGRTRFTFEFQVIRVWEHPVEELLAESLGLLPLAPLADLGRTTLPEVIARMDERVASDAPREMVPDLWTSTRILMGLRYDREVIRRVIRRVREMRESVTYQEILEEGREEGIVQGQV